MSDANDTLGSMDPLVALLIGLAIGLVIGLVIGLLIRGLRHVSAVTGECGPTRHPSVPN
jgi:ribose/xylose/arabinose/galactoside ABC-type transport system permease subunit